MCNAAYACGILVALGSRCNDCIFKNSAWENVSGELYRISVISGARVRVYCDIFIEFSSTEKKSRKRTREISAKFTETQVPFRICLSQRNPRPASGRFGAIGRDIYVVAVRKQQFPTRSGNDKL